MIRDKSLLFSEVPVRKAVLALAIPTMISQLITVVYNMVDTFFIGQLGDPMQVAAATIALPCFMLLNGFANLFGLGGSSLISRCLGSGDKEKARHTASLLHLDRGQCRPFLWDWHSAFGASFVPNLWRKGGNLGLFETIRILDRWHWRYPHRDEHRIGSFNPFRGIFPTGRFWRSFGRRIEYCP